MSPLLSIEDLSVSFPGESADVLVLRGVSFEVAAGEFVGLVGESGSGKSMTALAVLGLLPPGGRVASGTIRLEDRNLLELDEKEMRRVRGARIGIVFQEPMTALNPVFTVGFQIAEAIRVHHRMGRSEAWLESERLLDLVAIPSARQKLRDYPHQLSGGQRQRVMIAMALAARPDLLIADEPSTALDVTVQAQILELLEHLRRELGLAVLLITHDLAVVAETCERVIVMYAGQVVEQAPVETLFSSPSHPYTRGLLGAVPRLGAPVERGRLPTIPGQVPDPSRLPSGCAFHPRCDVALERCGRIEPELLDVTAGQSARCVLFERVVGAVAGEIE